MPLIACSGQLLARGGERDGEVKHRALLWLAFDVDMATVILNNAKAHRQAQSCALPNLFGRDPREVAIVEMWTRRAEMMIATPLMMAVRHAHPALAAIETQVPEIAANGRATAEKGLKVLNRHLAANEFIAGERVTIADILAVTAIDFARMVKFRPDEGLKHVVRWHAAMMARPAALAGV